MRGTDVRACTAAGDEKLRKPSSWAKVLVKVGLAGMLTEEAFCCVSVKTRFGGFLESTGGRGGGGGECSGSGGATEAVVLGGSMEIARPSPCPVGISGKRRISVDLLGRRSNGDVVFGLLVLRWYDTVGNTSSKDG